MIWYDMIWYDMTWHNMIWYEHAAPLSCAGQEQHSDTHKLNGVYRWLSHPFEAQEQLRPLDLDGAATQSPRNSSCLCSFSADFVSSTSGSITWIWHSSRSIACCRLLGSLVRIVNKLGYHHLWNLQLCLLMMSPSGRVYLVNNRGSRTDTWGTPVLSSVGTDCKSPTTTRCVRLAS